MFFQETLFPQSQTSMPLGTVAAGSGFCEPSRQTQCAAKLIPSVADEAGLGRFVYMRGASGKRYVFSAISQEQVVLYDKALFAVSSAGSLSVELITSCEELQTNHDGVYVHLLGDESGEDVLADIRPIQ